MGADIEHLRRGVERRQQQPRSKLKQGKPRQHEHRRKQHAVFYRAVDAVDLACAVVVADDGDKAVVYAEHGQEEKALQLKVRTVHGDGGLGKRHEQQVHDVVGQRAYAHHDDGREANFIDLADDASVGAEELKPERDLAVALEVEEKTQPGADGLTDHRCHRCARRAHCGQAAPAVDEKRVEHYIRHCAHHLRPHGKLRQTRRLQKALEGYLKIQEYRAHGDYLKIRACVVTHGGIVYLRVYEPLRTEHAEGKHRRPAAQAQKQCVARNSAGSVTVVSTKRTGYEA